VDGSNHLEVQEIQVCARRGRQRCGLAARSTGAVRHDRVTAAAQHSAERRIERNRASNLTPASDDRLEPILVTIVDDDPLGAEQAIEVLRYAAREPFRFAAVREGEQQVAERLGRAAVLREEQTVDAGPHPALERKAGECQREADGEPAGGRIDSDQPAHAMRDLGDHADERDQPEQQQHTRRGRAADHPVDVEDLVAGDRHQYAEWRGGQSDDACGEERAVPGGRRQEDQRHGGSRRRQKSDVEAEQHPFDSTPADG
jgi:hypothetical protein